VNFRPALAQAVVDGRKTVTRRVASENPRSPWSKDRCGMRVGRSYAVCPGRGKPSIGRVTITSTAIERLGYLDDAEARREGFDSAAEFVETFEALHGPYDPSVLVWRVEFIVDLVLGMDS
jgi:hypothetical protein